MHDSRFWMVKSINSSLHYFSSIGFLIPFPLFSTILLLSIPFHLFPFPSIYGVYCSGKTVRFSTIVTIHWKAIFLTKVIGLGDLSDWKAILISTISTKATTKINRTLFDVPAFTPDKWFESRSIERWWNGTIRTWGQEGIGERKMATFFFRYKTDSIRC